MGAHLSLASRAFSEGDFVLYRDPAAYHSGASPAECTFRCRVEQAGPASYRLRDLASSREWARARAENMRPLAAAAEVMRDIDTAPLESGDVSGLESAATAWLKQQAGGR